MKKYEELEKLKKLKEDGTITENEFKIEKEKILNTTKTNKKKLYIVVVIIIIVFIIVALLALYKNTNNNIEKGNINKETSVSINKTNGKQTSAISKKLSFNSMKNDKKELEKLSDSEKAVIEYFNDDYFTIWDTEELNRYPAIYKNANLRLEGFVEKVIKSTEDEFEALVYVTPIEEFGEFNPQDYNYNENTVVINSKQVVERFIEGDSIVIYGNYNTVKTYEIDGKTYTKPNITVNSMQKDLERFTTERIEQVAKYLFGNDIKLREYIYAVDSYIEPGPYTVVTLDNQSNANFKAFNMNRNRGYIEYNAPANNLSPYDNKRIFISSDLQHFIVTTYDEKSKKGYLDYFSKDLTKIWGREFNMQTEFTVTPDTMVSPFDYTTSILAINIDNDLYLIDMETGENIVDPILVGKKSKILIKDDKIILVGIENKDTIMIVDLKGNIIKKYNGDTTINEIEHAYIQNIDNKTIIKIEGTIKIEGIDREYQKKYKFIVLNENGELETSTTDIISSY